MNRPTEQEVTARLIELGHSPTSVATMPAGVYPGAVVAIDGTAVQLREVVVGKRIAGRVISDESWSAAHALKLSGRPADEALEVLDFGKTKPRKVYLKYEAVMYQARFTDNSVMLTPSKKKRDNSKMIPDYALCADWIVAAELAPGNVVNMGRWSEISA